MPELRVDYVCPYCGSAVSFFGRRLDVAPVCYRCGGWPEMEARELREPSPILVSDVVPDDLRGLAKDMRENREVRL